jgi:tRNA(Ile)-lysidine synthase
VTIDHGLRPEAAAEALAVGAICERLGILHETRRWTGSKPATGIAGAARLARYALLAQAAEAHGCDVVLTGHTMDDQAETVAMRQPRGEGRGLAGMATATLYRDRTWILRPLLGLRRAALREALVDADIGWIDDPSNDNTAAERVRVRRALAAEPGAVERLAAIAARAGDERRADAEAAAAWLACAQPVGPGRVSLPRHALGEDAPLTAVRALLAAIGGAEHLPAEAATLALLERLRTGGNAALAHTLVRRTGGILMLERERRGGTIRAATIPATGTVAPWATFLPGFDIALRNAVGRLVGVAAVPHSPAA